MLGVAASNFCSSTHGANVCNFHHAAAGREDLARRRVRRSAFIKDERACWRPRPRCRRGRNAPLADLPDAGHHRRIVALIPEYLARGFGPAGTRAAYARYLIERLARRGRSSRRRSVSVKLTTTNAIIRVVPRVERGEPWINVGG